MPFAICGKQLAFSFFRGMYPEMNAEAELSEVRQRLEQLENLCHDLVKTLEKVALQVPSSLSESEEIQDANALISLVKDILPTGNRRGYIKAGEAQFATFADMSPASRISI
jgi:hypothetical protein